MPSRVALSFLWGEESRRRPAGGCRSGERSRRRFEGSGFPRPTGACSRPARGSPRRSAPLEGTRLCSRRSPWSPPVALGCRSLHLNAPAHTTSNSTTSVSCVSVKTLRFDSRARNKCLRILASSHDDCNLHRTVTRAGTDAPQVSICKSKGGHQNVRASGDFLLVLFTAQ